ncbi:MAG: exostosin family protein [Minisyncoccia bacterium]
MLKAFIPEPLPLKRLVPFIADAPQGGSRLFQDLPQDSFRDIFARTLDIASADIVILPHEYAVLRENDAYLSTNLQAAEKAGKRVLISAYQDSPEPIRIQNTIVLRPSAYRSTLLSHELLMPAYVEDLGTIYGTEILPKGERPSVGFIGKASFANVYEAARYAVRNYLMRHGPEREGVYFRRHAIASLSGDTRIDFCYTARRSFSGNRKSIELPPEEARRAYVDSIRSSLFTLAPRGDGNFSLRFYETLSMGRIPLLIDTDVPLPLEDELSYDSFILRVPSEETDRVAEHVAAFYSRTSDAKLQAMQKRARDAFLTHLSMPAFLRRTLTKEKLRI